MISPAIAEQDVAADRMGAWLAHSLRLALAAFGVTLVGLVLVLAISLGLTERLPRMVPAVSLVALFGVAQMLSFCGLLLGLASMWAGRVQDGLKGVAINIVVAAADGLATVVSGYPLFALMALLGIGD